MALNAFVDSRNVPDGHRVSADVCIVGAGAAGITIAREFAGRRESVVLLESGGLDFEPRVQALGTAEIDGRALDDPLSGRMRRFGGSTHLWGGHCVPLQPGDFEKRPGIAYSGWPFGHDELVPYYRRAHELLQIGAFDYDAAMLARKLGVTLFPFDPAVVQSTVSRYNPMRFGAEFGQLLNDAANVRVMLFANVTSVNLGAGRSSVGDVTVRTLAGNAFGVAARRFVLASGGIDNARILLASDREQPHGLGNQHDLVGRFFQGHLWFRASRIVPAGNARFLRAYVDRFRYEERASVGFHVALPDRLSIEMQLPMFRSELAIGSFVVDAGSQVRRAMAGREALDAESIRVLATRPLAAANRMICRAEPAPDYYALDNYPEQLPNPESRIMLSKQRDALGQPLSKIRWRISSHDKQGLIEAQRILAREVGRSGYGRMQIRIPEQEEHPLDGAHTGYHHIGTTRMHDDPRQGVVDRDARVHGVANLFVAGSSVFPTGGWPNPTLTIVALSIRLADHLKRLSARDAL
ncbi:MAG TPA: GMC family oxidoreductase [Burkholderiaceae bacterium]|jgi:choline dehydrogenase-like flavoprotein|nr:GMC family oxidoreductase [Burkholderiaceae bacterium]